MANLISRFVSGADFWDKDENKKQREQFAREQAQAPKQSFGNRVRDVFDANTASDQYRRTQQGRPAIDTNADNPAGRAATSVLAGLGRFGGAGTAQVVGGAYDLLTPGVGTNRVSDWGSQKARELDVVGREHGYSPIYTGTQIAGEIASMAAVPKLAASLVSKAPRFLAPTANAVTKWNNNVVPQVGNVVQKGLTAANMPTIGRVANYGVKNGLTATDLAQDALITGKMMFQDASRGTQITPQRVAMDAGLMAFGNPAGAAVFGGAGKLVRSGANAVNNVPSNVRNKVSQKALEKAAQNLTPQDRAIYEGIYRYHTNPQSVNPQEANFLLSAGRQLDQKYGIDSSVAGSRGEFKQRIARLIDESMKPRKPSLLADEGGYAKVPGKAPQVGKTYKTVHQGGKSVDVQGEPVKIADGIDTFVHKDENGNWVVSETTTGRSLTGGGYPNRHHAEQAARDLINDKGVATVKAKIAELATPVKSPLESNLEAGSPSTRPKGQQRTSPPAQQVQNRPVQARSNQEPQPQQPQTQPGLLKESPIARPSQTRETASLETKIQQKPKIVNEGRRAVSGADRTTFGLRDSFDQSDNVPSELKEALGAFGNERTVRSNKELWSTAQKRVNDDPAEAMRYFKENSSDDAVATGYALINSNMKSGNVKAAGELSIEMAERALESGRTTQAYALMKRLTPEGAIGYVEKKVSKFIKDNPNMAKKVKWNDQVRKSLYDQADALNKLPEGRQRNLAIGKLQNDIDNIFPSGKMDKAVTIWKAGLLTSLRTHERNILGNTVNMAGEQAALVPGSLADRIMALRTGKRTLVAAPGKNMASGAKVGAQIAKDQIKTGIDVAQSNLKYNINHITWGDNKVEQSLKKMTEGVFRPLGAEDKLFKESIRTNSLYNQAAAMGKTKKLHGQKLQDFIQEKLKNPSAKMLDVADNDSARGTFTHDNFLGDIIKNAKGAVRRSNKPGARAASAFLDILMPFTQVPSGVASQLYAYSPAKLLKSTYDIGKVLVTGDETLQRQAAQGFGRSVIGTSIIGSGAYLAANGLMTGDPKDDAEKAQWEAQGIKPNSVKIGNRWYGLQSVGPQFILALAGGQMVADKEQGNDPFTKLAANLGNNLSEQTFIKGMSSFVDAIKEPERNLDFYIQSQATSIVPNIVKDLTKALDPNERQTNNVWDRFKGSVPGVSKSLPERKDSYGETIKNSGVLEMVDLFNSSTQKDVPEAQVIDALRKATGEKIHVPSKADRSIEINGERRKLSSKEYSDYQGFIGSYSKTAISRLTKDSRFNDRFNSLADSEKVKLLDDLFQDVNSAAKIKLFGNKPKNKVPEAIQSIVDDNLLRAIELKLAKKAVSKDKQSSTRSKKGRSGKSGGRAGRGAPRTELAKAIEALRSAPGVPKTGQLAIGSGKTPVFQGVNIQRKNSAAGYRTAPKISVRRGTV